LSDYYFHFVFSFSIVVRRFNLDPQRDNNTNISYRRNNHNHHHPLFYQTQPLLNVEEEQQQNSVHFHQQFHQNQNIISSTFPWNKRPHFSTSEHAPNSPEKMEENYPYHQFNHQSKLKSTRPSRLGLRNNGNGGEIVEVQGGHIVRSTGRKDRHSKVCTAKGTRDRRVRLAAHTAIQFYDVQDRLGYDRPSKAVDWLIKKAKSSIDELAELPPWKPPIVSFEQNPNVQNPNNENPNYHRLEDNQDDEIIDSIKSFFPASGSSTPSGNNSQFHRSYPPSELFSKPSNQNQDLKLSLQSVEGNSVFFDGSGWPENSGYSGFVFNSPATQTTPFLQPLYGKPTNSQLLNYISQRGPLQSSNTPPVRAWIDPLPFTGSVIDQHQTLGFHHPSGFSSGVGGGFSGFHIPARIEGVEEEHDGISDKPSSASSDSCH